MRVSLPSGVKFGPTYTAHLCIAPDRVSASLFPSSLLHYLAWPMPHCTHSMGLV